MAEFFTAQLDYIFFIYGLAFLLLASICFSSRGPIQTVLPWRYLGFFGLLHGINEWLDLVALMFGDSMLFVELRLAMMLSSFAMLVEFGRIGFVRLGRRSIGPWIYIPLLSFALLGGLIGGVKGLNDGSRYAFGLTGCLWTAAAFWFRAHAFNGGLRHSLTFASFVMAAYGVAAGLIVPASPFFLAPWWNQELFFSTTGLPIQLVRGALACAIAGSIWVYEQKRFGESELTERRAHYFRLSVAALVLSLLFGWGITNGFGQLYQQEVWHQVDAELALVSERLSAATGMTRGLALNLSRSPLLANGNTPEVVDLVDRYSQVSNGLIVYIANSKGKVIVTSNRTNSTSLLNQNYGFRPYFKEAMRGKEGGQFALGVTTGLPGFYASAPIRNAYQEITGVLVVKKTLSAEELGLRHFPHGYLIDKVGNVLLAGEEQPPQKLWPSDLQSISAENLAVAPLHNGERVRFQGKSFLVGMRAINEEGWSIVVLQREHITLVSRLFGITVTLMICSLILIATVGMQREISTQIQLHQNQMRLQELSLRLERQAMTDTLTGAANRLKFDEVLTAEYNRAVRYGTPLSLIMYDIDHFKQINDRYGHHAGDMVLVELTKLVQANIRDSDTLARWGGEEFMIIVPQSTRGEATALANKLRQIIDGNSFAGVVALTCSFGVVQLATGETPESLCNRADSALYEAKVAGRDRVVLA